MQIILLERIHNLGHVGETVKVRNGYGRNFLIPQKKALRATESNRAFFEAQRAQIEQENAAKRTAAEQEAKTIENVFVTILRQVGEDGRLFGSVTTRDIAAQLQADGHTIDRRTIHLQQPIKTLGVHPIKLSLHPEVQIEIRVNVARNAEEAEQEKQDFLNPAAKEERLKKAQEKEQEEEAAREASKFKGKKKKARRPLAGGNFLDTPEDSESNE